MKCILITVFPTLNLFANLITHLLPYKPPPQIHINFFFLFGVLIEFIQDHL